MLLPYRAHFYPRYPGLPSSATALELFDGTSGNDCADSMEDTPAKPEGSKVPYPLPDENAA
jgi:hypothetical protein